MKNRTKQEARRDFRIILVIVTLSAMFSGYAIGKFSGLSRGEEHGRDLERQEIYSAIKEGIFRGAPFSLAGMDVKFVPTGRSKAVLVEMLLAKYNPERIRYCYVCHGRQDLRIERVAQEEGSGRPL